MLNELGNYCVPDLNTVLFGIPTSDFNTNHRIMITVQKYTDPHFQRKMFQECNLIINIHWSCQNHFTVQGL